MAYTDHKKFDQFVTDARRDESNPFEPPPLIVCPNCDGDLSYLGPNKNKTLSFIACIGKCKQMYTVTCPRE